MAVNKVIFGGETVIDLTNDSVTPSTLAEGVTAHDKTGALITGTMQGGGGGGVETCTVTINFTIESNKSFNAALLPLLLGTTFDTANNQIKSFSESFPFVRGFGATTTLTVECVCGSLMGVLKGSDSTQLNITGEIEQIYNWYSSQYTIFFQTPTSSGSYTINISAE